jgi:curli biogenesis system outer membrane secretion channel CsgG
MRTIVKLALLVWLCSCSLALAAATKEAKPPVPPEYKGLKKRLGVLEVDVKVPGYATYQSTPSIPGVSLPVVTTQTEALPGNIGAAMTEQLTTALVNTGRFIVLERKALQEVMREQDLGASGRVNKETAAPIGEMTGAEWLIKAAITEFESKKSSTGGIIGFRRLGGIGARKAEAFLKMDVRIIDAATGQVIDSVPAEGRAKRTGAAAVVGIGDVAVGMLKEDRTPIGAATREALAKAINFICDRMEKMPWRGRVMEIEGSEIYLNAGSNMNLKVGDTFDVFRAGKQLKDPDTGQVLGVIEKRVGRLRVDQVQEKIAIGTMTEGEAPQRGDIVRPVQ